MNHSDDLIPSESKGENLNHSALKVVGGPGDKKIVESPEHRTSEPKEFDLLKGDTNRGGKILSSGSRLVVNVEATKIEKFFVEGLPFTQLSDHYGISAQLEII